MTEARYTGSIDYWRLDRSRWDAALKRLKDGGLDAVHTCIPWREHEPSRGAFDFGESRTSLDVGAFIDEAARQGLGVLLDIGPYARADLPYFGLPDHLVVDDAIKARGPTGQPVVSWLPPAMFHPPTLASRLFDQQIRIWFGAVSQHVRPRLAPSGPVVQLAIDRVGPLGFIDNVYARNYHPEALTQWHAFVREHYGTVDSAARAHGAGYTDWSEVQAPTDPIAITRDNLALHLDWARFAETLVVHANDVTVGMLAGAGLDEVPIQTTRHVAPPRWLASLRRSSIERVQHDAAKGTTTIRFDGTDADDPRWRTLRRALTESRHATLTLRPKVAIVVSPVYRALTAATHTGGFVGPTLLQASGPTRGAACTASTFGFDTAIQTAWPAALATLGTVLEDNDIAFEVFDEDWEVEDLLSFAVVLVPTYDVIDEALWSPLTHLGHNGLAVIYGPSLPTHNERLEPTNFAAPEGARRVTAWDTDTLEALFEDLDADYTLRRPFCCEPPARAYVHYDGDEPRLVALINPQDQPVDAVIALPKRTQLRDVAVDQSFVGTTSVTVPLSPRGSRFLAVEPAPISKRPSARASVVPEEPS